MMSWMVTVWANKITLLFPVKEFSFRAWKPLEIRSWLILSNFLWVLGCLITYQSCLCPLKIISISLMTFWHLKVLSFKCCPLCNEILSPFSMWKCGWRWRGERVWARCVIWKCCWQWWCWKEAFVGGWIFSSFNLVFATSLHRWWD